MKFPRTIGFRISFGFGLLFMAIILNAFYSIRSITRIHNSEHEISAIIDPSIHRLIDLKGDILQSKDKLLSWKISGEDAESPLLIELRQILQGKIPSTHRQILRLSGNWRERDREAYGQLYKYMSDSLYQQIAVMSSNLNNFSLNETPDAGNPMIQLLRSYQFTITELSGLIERFERLSLQSGQNSQTIYQSTKNNIILTSSLIAFSTLLISILLYYTLLSPFKNIREAISFMGKGIIPKEKLREGPDEMGEIGSALNIMIKGLRDLYEFSVEIGKGNFKSEFTPLSENDSLGNSLIDLREDLQNAAIEEEKRKREDERRNWSNQGIARFSEILRENSGNLETLSEKLISELVKYLGARVGGLFLIRTNDPDGNLIELIASYAYDRSKHLIKTIEPGEGLVGRCVQEGATIFLTDIPENYISIKSGLGKDNPRSLLIVPIRPNELIIGVIEIASLEIFHEFQIEFVERIGTSIASSLSRK